jgi:hypothetical protein
MGSLHSTTRTTRALSPRLSAAIPSLRPESSAGLLTTQERTGTNGAICCPFALSGSGAERKSVFVGWHAARRGLRSNLYPLGVPDMVIQRIPGRFLCREAGDVTRRNNQGEIHSVSSSDNHRLFSDLRRHEKSSESSGGFHCQSCWLRSICRSSGTTEVFGPRNQS